jgi:hypothetical protein
MYRYYAACPITNRPIDTGLETDRQTLSFAMHETIDVFCPDCGKPHRFKVSDLFAPSQRGERH